MSFHLKCNGGMHDLMSYDPALALEAIDRNIPLIAACLAVALGLSFVYFIIGIRMAIKQKVYVEPFMGASLFLWHDGSYAAQLPHWAAAYDSHWWLMMWSYGLMGTVALEAFLLYQFVRYGRKELFPEMSEATFAAMTMAGVLAVGAVFWLIKASLNDPLYFITFAITAFWSTPWKVGIMMRRRSNAGQSVSMNLCVFFIFAAVSLVFMTVAPAFRTAPYLATLAVFMIWPLFNIWMIRRMPSAPLYPEQVPIKFGNQRHEATWQRAATV
jgi:hypothetical protein